MHGVFRNFVNLMAPFLMRTVSFKLRLCNSLEWKCSRHYTSRIADFKIVARITSRLPCTYIHKMLKMNLPVIQSLIYYNYDVN